MDRNGLLMLKNMKWTIMVSSCSATVCDLDFLVHFNSVSYVFGAEVSKFIFQCGKPYL